MHLIITESYEQSAVLAARRTADAVKQNPNALLGLATGTTPIPLYQELCRMQSHGEVDLCGVSTINLDEYVGLAGDDENSYLYFMRKHLLDPIGISLSHVYIPNGAADPTAEIKRMNDFADQHPIDVQVLSVGENGHIGFNEPGDVFFDKYHLVKLTESTRKANSRLFSDISQVPTYAITMGIGGIMRAREIVFLATGKEKLAAMKAMLEEGDVTPKNQGTILKFHQACTIYLDKEIAAGIQPAKHVKVTYAK